MIHKCVHQLELLSIAHPHMLSRLELQAVGPLYTFRRGEQYFEVDDRRATTRDAHNDYTNTYVNDMKIKNHAIAILRIYIRTRMKSEVVLF